MNIAYFFLTSAQDIDLHLDLEMFYSFASKTLKSEQKIFLYSKREDKMFGSKYIFMTDNVAHWYELLKKVTNYTVLDEVPSDLEEYELHFGFDGGKPLGLHN
jgi:hypothetical protein